MAAPLPDPAILALAQARDQLAKSCDALITRPSFFATFNESIPTDYARWRRDLEQFITPAGDDFVAALKHPGVIVYH